MTIGPSLLAEFDNEVSLIRGQLSVYVRLLDVSLPRIYGPSADTA